MLAATVLLMLSAAPATLPAAPAGARLLASTHQVSVLEDEVALLNDPMGTLKQMRSLGVQQARVAVIWSYIAPSAGSRLAPRRFRAGDPAAYPAANWAPWDQIVSDAQREGIAINFDVVGAAPLWALGPGRPSGNHNQNWDPSPSMYQAFVHALGVRYSGSYDPVLRRTVHDVRDLPRVSFWSVWNEPNYGPSLAPQGVLAALKIENSPRIYRNLVDAAWSALHQTGHGGDQFIFGELADRDQGPTWGIFSGMAPLVFLRAMYCVDSGYRPLRGVAAALRGCPATATGSRAFSARNPGLFQASGVSDHAYMRWYAPNNELDPNPDFSSLAQIGNLERAVDRLEAAYGSRARPQIWNTEFGYITSPPKHVNQYEPIAPHYYPWVSPTTAAYYLNWAEYISWRDPRIASFFQYLLRDPQRPNAANDWGGFASGLITWNGKRKVTYDAWRLPLYLPVTRARRGQPLEVWGCVRPAPYALHDTGVPQVAELQYSLRSTGVFRTLRTIALPGPNCYFDVRVPFPANGAVRIRWIYPTRDPLLGYIDPLRPLAAYSRTVRITLT